MDAIRGAQFQQQQNHQNDQSNQGGGATLEHRVINARRHLVEVRKRRDDAKNSLNRLKNECDMSRAVEDSLFRQLVECEQEIHSLFRDLVDTPSTFMAKATNNNNNENNNDGNTSSSSSLSLPVIDFDDGALVQLISLRTRAEETTLRRLQDDLEAAEREYSKVSKLSQVQRAEMLRLVKSVAKEYRVLETTSAKEESELYRLKQETQDVIARTHANKVRIVKELFQL